MLKDVFPETKFPIVPVEAIAANDGLWVQSKRVAELSGDPIAVAKVTGLLNYNKGGEIHVVLRAKSEYSEADLQRAVALITEADGLSTK